MGKEVCVDRSDAGQKSLRGALSGRGGAERRTGAAGQPTNGSSTQWVIDGRVEAVGGGTITYALAARPGGTEFRREFVYEVPSLPLKVLDRLVLRRRIAAESAEALRRLKRVLEAD